MLGGQGGILRQRTSSVGCASWTKRVFVTCSYTTVCREAGQGGRDLDAGHDGKWRMKGGYEWCITRKIGERVEYVVYICIIYVVYSRIFEQLARELIVSCNKNQRSVVTTDQLWI